MYDEEELKLLDDEIGLDEPLDPLDQIEALNEEEVTQPEPEEMLALLENPQPEQRMLAARAFCDIKDTRATPFLIRLLTDTCPLVRVSAAYGIGRNPSPKAVEPLIKQMNQDWNGYVRKGVVWALGNCRDRRWNPFCHGCTVVLDLGSNFYSRHRGWGSRLKLMNKITDNKTPPQQRLLRQ